MTNLDETHFGLDNRDGLESGPARKVLICDVTLREGEQTAGVRLTLDDKLRLAAMLDELGVGQIQLNHVCYERTPAEAAALRRLGLKAKLEIMTSANRTGWRDHIRAAVDAGADVLHTNLATSPYVAHMHPAISEAESVDRVREAIEVARGAGASEINVTFVDAPRTPWPFLERLIAAAAAAGASRVRIPDSAGVATPRGLAALTARARAVLERSGRQVLLGVHCHDDLGCATANCLAAFEAGADLFDLAFNGLGERAGNADLAQVVPLLALVHGAHTGVATERLVHACRVVAEVTGRPVPSNAPFVGELAFADHEGIHHNARARQPFAFQAFWPERVGNRTRVLLGAFATEQSLRAKADEIGCELADAQLPELVVEVHRQARRSADGLVDDDAFRRLARRLSA